ncbi:hypothetical protein PIIN_04570 [Serendipita indica DSM 11827]|uniref:C2H2-type domain-containing protein n=1 Tax=Serendipita indica (strain DSM 11827) TaxID=1109443 RepID=G4TH51_SERID|nr:hypothetical protein PIIN_04570 [Serendipita indica DSM 11827]
MFSDLDSHIGYHNSTSWPAYNHTDIAPYMPPSQAIHSGYPRTDLSSLMGDIDSLARSITPPVQGIDPFHDGFFVPPNTDLVALLEDSTNPTNATPMISAVHGHGLPSASPSHSMTLASQNDRPTCPHCGGTHPRPVRYRACRNKHLGLRPFACAGECGEPTCVKTFASAERKKAHTRGRVICDKCGKLGWKKNQARHRESCF